MRYIYLLLLAFSSNALFAQFAPPVIIDSTNNTLAKNCVVVDMNNDTQNDILFSFLSDSICWYQNNNLTFIKRPSIYITGINLITHFDVADIDGNGDKEVLVSVKSNIALNNKVLLYQFNGSSWLKTVIDSNITLNIAKSNFVDIDNDGDLDIMSCHDIDVVKYINTGGVYSARNVIVSTSEYYNMAIRDFDGNGFKDFMVHSANGTQLHLANSTNTAYNQTTIAPEIRSLLETEDIDNDGDFDMLYSDVVTLNQLEANKNNGAGGFTFFQSLPIYVSNQPVVPLEYAKIDGDSFLDLVYKNITASGIEYRLNDGVGNYLTPLFVDSVYNYTFVTAGNLNNDQKADIVWVASAANNKKYIGYTINTNPTGIDNVTKQSGEMEFFPNPAINSITLKHTFTSTNNYVSISNGIGEIMFKCSGLIPAQINLTSWPMGTYFLNVNGYAYKLLKN